MSIDLKITKRDVVGKKASRRLRHEGFVPGIVYGENKDSVLISVGEKELLTVCYSLSFFGHIVNFTIGSEQFKVLPRDIRFDALTNRPIHVDFQRVSKDSKVKVSIPVEFENEDKCPGIKKGGLLNIVVHRLDCFCSPEFIPENIVIDLAGREIGESFELKDVVFPEGVVVVNLEKDSVLATIVAAKDEEVSSGAETAEQPGA